MGDQPGAHTVTHRKTQPTLTLLSYRASETVIEIFLIYIQLLMNYTTLEMNNFQKLCTDNRFFLG